MLYSSVIFHWFCITTMSLPQGQGSLLCSLILPKSQKLPGTWQAFNKYCWMGKNKAALNLLWILTNHAFFFFFASKPLLRWLSLKPYPCPPRKLPDTSLIKCLILCPNFILSNQNYLLVCLTLSKLKDPMSQGLMSWMSVVSSPNSGLRRQ